MSPGKSLFGKKNNLQTIRDYPLPPSCSVSNLTEFLADGNASFLRAARSGNLEKVIEFLKGSIDINTSNANGLNALHLAAKEGHVNVVTELLKRGANVNAATKKGNTALHIASLAGQEEVVKVLIQLGANVNVQSQNGFTPLYMAAQENHDNVVSFLLSSGANQSLATEDGFTPLAVALQQGHDKVVAVLLENDTKGKVRLPALHIAAKKDDCKAATLLLQSDHNPDVTSKSGFTPLHIAAHYGNENIAKILLSKGADVNFPAKHQITPLHVASKWGKLNMVVLLLEKGAHIDASTRDGLTPLHCAARSGHDMVVDLLLEKGAPFLAKTKNGLAPLHMASQGDHVDSARILLFHKAPVDDVTVDYLTALHVAAHCGHVKVAKLLLDRKADANARALNGFTPLHIACKKNRIKVVELLLKHGASIEATTESGLTPLHVASFMGCMNIVIYLIQNGANPDVPTVRGETPLHLAARANQTDIIRILLRNGASVDARAREEQTPLHIAARLGNVDIVSLLLQHGAAVDAVTKDMYTALHITAKEDQEEVAAALLDHGASLTATTKKGFTPLHLAAKYGNIKVARLLLQKGAPVDAQGKNGVTPLHVAAHYDHVNVALLLLDKGASPHAMAKNGYTPLHIAAKKNQMDIASTLLEYGANTNSESKAGFTPLHLASQEGHADMSSLLIENKANVNQKANNGLTPLHLCAQDDRVNVAQVLVRNGAEICPQTKAGYTPLHVACHFGQINMVRFLLQNDANVHTVTSHGYTPLHQAAQQGHTLVVNLLLENQASPNVTTVQGQTPLSIAQRLGYISVVETLKVVTETTVTTTTTTVTEEKYKVVAPETMQETFMTDSEDEGGEEAMLGDQSYRYLTADEMKSLGDDSLPIDVTKDEKQQDAMQAVKQFGAPMVEEDNLSPQHGTPVESGFSEKFSPDNVDLAKAPVHAGFLVSFMVDARGGAMRGCRHSGVRVIIPPRKASMPMRITCRYLRKEKLIHPPPLMEGEACASRILEMGPVGARFLGPVIIEVPHFASTRGKEREITILRSDTGESWREHTLEASEEAVQEVLNESFEGEELSALEDLNTNRITRILTTDFPQYFAIVTRIRQEVHGVGPEGGMVSSTVVPQVQAIFPEGALTKKIRVGLQAQPIAPELVAKLLGNRVAVSPIVTVEPRRRKFHKPITLTIPVPQAATKGMINQYSGDAPTLRLLCSITGSTKSGGSSKAQWEDVTGSTPLTFVNDCVSFTTTVSARFWLMDCRQVNEVTRFATELYQEAVYVPFMSKFVIFAKRHDPFEAQLRVFCMTDDKEDKTLEHQEHFTEVAKSRDVEVLEGKLQYLEFAGNLVPVTKSGEQLKLDFQAFHENRLPFTIRVKDPHVEAMGRIAFMKEPKAGRGEPPQTPICNLNVALPDITMTEANADVLELVTLEKSYDFMKEAGLSKPESIHRADLRLSDIARELDKDWILLAQQLDIPEQDTEQIKAQTVCEPSEQARMMLRLWLQKSGPKATGNELEKGLRKINREDIINKCMFNVELVTDDVEKAVAKVHLDQSGFDVFKEELGSSREASMRRGASLDVSYDEQDIMKEAESAAETSSETGSLFERDQLSQALTDEKGGIGLEKLKEISALLPEIKDSELKKPIETELRTVEVIGVQEIPAKLTESETWPSGDLDTSQVSVSSLPDDEKSEPTTATVSSTAAVTIDTIKKVVPDTDSSAQLMSGIDKKDEQVVAEMVTKSLESPSSDLDAALKSPESVSAALESVKERDPSEHVQQLSSENLIRETDTSAVEDLPKRGNISLPLTEDRVVSESQYVEKSESSFVPCAFINTAFAGADAIDEVEQVSPIRARSPYEVVRGPDSISDDIPAEERDIPSTVERVSHITRHVEIRRRPILQHIPSEISEEDLVEREITSPVSKDDVESFDVSTRTERKLSEDELSDIQVVRTVTRTKIIQSSGDYEDKAGEVLEPLEISQELQSTASTSVPDSDTFGMKVVKTITTTRVIERSEHDGDDDANAELIHGLPIGVESEVLGGELSRKTTTTVTTTKVIQGIDDHEHISSEGTKRQDILEKASGVKEVIETPEIPADIKTEIFEDESSGTRIVKKIITTTRIVSSSGDFDEGTDETSLDVKEGITASDKSVVSGDDLSSVTIVKTSQTISHSEYLEDPSSVATKEEDFIKGISPKSDTEMPSSPYEIISESELINGNQKSSTLPASQSCSLSGKDNTITTTTHSQSVTVSVAPPKDETDSCSKLPEQSETKVSPQQAIHTIVTATDSKPLTNGPGEVEYHAEYDYYDEKEEKYGTEDIPYSGGHSGLATEAEDSKKVHYSTVSDDAIDSEIKDILDSDQQLDDDIIERPVTPEPPGDDGSDLRFIRGTLKHPNEEAIEGSVRETDFAYTDDDAISPSSDSKSGFAYGMQFEKYGLDQAEEAMDVDSDQYSEEKEPSFSYGMRFERDPDLDEEDIPCYGDLYTHEEEDEDALENGEKIKIVPKPVKDSDFDILAGRKFFTKNMELDELSMSSLQEFERLEAEIVSGRKSSIGSMDSLNGKQAVSKSGEHDDVSMSSLTEFERIERECTEVEKIDPSMQESITQLSEIEEGHESQASETSQENKSDAGKDEDVSILEDYNNELENIEEIILQTDGKKTEELPFQFMLKHSQKTDLIGDSTELIYKDDKFIDSKVLDVGKQKSVRSNIATEVTKISSWATSKSLESSSLGDAKDDLDQDSLRDELSLKPDSLIDDGKHDFQDSLHEERFDDADSLQEENLDEMRDSLFEERHIEDDSLHEMDILPDESSLSLEGSLPAVASLDSSKADDPVKEKVMCIKDSRNNQQELGQGIALDVFQFQGKTQINVSDLPRGVDVMQSSTDSLEQSSSAGLAAFHVESESLMSSSLNSAITSEDYTMVSSTDTLEHEGRITYRYEDIPVDDIELLVRGGHKVIVDSEGNIQTHYDNKTFISTDEVMPLGLSKNVTQPPTTEVQVHPALTTVKYVNGDKTLEKSNVFSSSEQGQDYTSFESSHFDPDVEVEEFETTDEFGNTKVIRRIKKVTRSKAQFSSSSSSKDVEEKLKEFLKEHTAGDDAGSAKEEVEEQRTTDDKGNVVVIRTVKQQILTEPEVHSRTFTGPNADQQSQQYVETFQTLNPTEDVSEYEKIDEQGNVVRVTQKFVVTPQVHTVSFSGPDAHKQMEDYMKQWTLQSQNIGEFEGDQQRTVLPALQMPRSSEQSDASIPTDASESLVHNVTGGTVVTKTVVSTFSTDSPEKLTKPESSTSSSSLLESEKVKTSDLTDASSMPK